MFLANKMVFPFWFLLPKFSKTIVIKPSPHSLFRILPFFLISPHPIPIPSPLSTVPGGFFELWRLPWRKKKPLIPIPTTIRWLRLVGTRTVNMRLNGLWNICSIGRTLAIVFLFMFGVRACIPVGIRLPCCFDVVWPSSFIKIWNVLWCLEMNQWFLVILPLYAEEADSIPKEYRPPTEAELHQFFLPYRGFCARKGVNDFPIPCHNQ